MFKIEGKTIHCTRGDTGTIALKIPISDSEDYEFTTSDKVIFTVKNKYSSDTPIIRKEITFEEPTSTCIFTLTKEDTTIGNLINDAKTYYYDIALGEDKTVIGFDETGGKEFILYPEASNDD